MNPYARAKLCEFVEEIFCDIRGAREKLLDASHFLVSIDPNDFDKIEHQERWRQVRNSIVGKITNFGTRRIPMERITVRNTTLEKTLRAIWSIYLDVLLSDPTSDGSGTPHFGNGIGSKVR